MKKKRIYLDHAATTPIDPEVLKAITPYFLKSFGNPMSIHSFGQEAQAIVDESRGTIANFLGCSTKEIVFTSGATESNNLAVKGILQSWKKQQKASKPHFIVSAIEHHCILETCKILEKDGEIELTVVPVNFEGVVQTSNIAKAIKKNTALISIMYVNNEIGTVQPIKEIGEIVLAARKNSLYPLFHTDATQAVSYFDCDVWGLNIDLLSFSGHKIYGPKGIGVLYVKKGVPLKRIQDGGDQEYSMRAGTHNVPGIVGIAAAIKQIKSKSASWRKKNKNISKLRDYLIKKIIKEIPESHLNGSLKLRSPNNVNFRFDNVEGEGLILALDFEGFACSTGSACSSGSLDPSHVLIALGLKHEEVHGSLRITLGRDTVKEDLDKFVFALNNIVRRLQLISGSVLRDYYAKKKK